MSSKTGPTLRVLTASNQRLSKISHITCPSPRNEVAVLNADGNTLSTLSGVECYPALTQLSACGNSIVKMEAVRHAANLVTLNLQGNSISEVAGLEGLVNLQWLSLAGNTLMNMTGFEACVKLNYLDLSENCITGFGDITSLSCLKTLLLHGNAITSLQSVPQCLPASLLTLSLADNDVSDLNEASFLRGLPLLEQLSLLNNPCVSITDTSIFDFRPYVMFWCPTLTVLDGVEVTAKERQSSQTLFPPDQPYPFGLGEHHVLVHYLSSIYSVPSIPKPESAEKGRISLPDKSPAAASLSELEGLLAGSSSTEHAGLVSKLRALQLVEQMISTQEQLLGAKDGHVAQLPAEAKAESAIHQASLINGGTPSKTELQALRGVERRADMELVGGGSDFGAKALSGATEGSGGGGFAALERTDGDDSSIGTFLRAFERDKGAKGSAATSPPVPMPPRTGQGLQGRGHQQLRLLNEKLAKRHSKLPRREASKLQGSALSNGFTAGPSRLLGSAPAAAEAASSVGGGGGALLSGDMSAGLSWSTGRFREGLDRAPPGAGGVMMAGTGPGGAGISSVSKVTLPIVSQGLPGKSAALQPRLFKAPQSPPTRLQSTGVFTTEGPLPTTFPSHGASPNTSLLDSETSYLPVLPTDLSSSSHTTQDPGDQDTDHYVTSLLSSLDSAYGYSSLTEKSRLLSSLMGGGEVGVAGGSGHPPPSGLSREQAAVRLQAAYRGRVCREEYRRQQRQARAATAIQALWRGYVSRKRDPQVRAARAEISRRKVESFAHTLHSELQSCKQELAEQVRLTRLQQQTLQTLLTEVRELQSWRDEVRGRRREKAALLLQRHWRGYAARKHYPQIARLLSGRRCWCVSSFSLTPQKQQVPQSPAVLNSSVKLSASTHVSPAPAPAEDLPSLQDLQMSHFSDNCILLQWTPPMTTPHGPSHSGTERQGYRVYVNGMAEGTVGADKLKAYIEGLDMDTTYRITVRVVYSTGESRDSNPIIASLNRALPSGISGHRSNLLRDSRGGTPPNPPTLSPLTETSQGTISPPPLELSTLSLTPQLSPLTKTAQGGTSPNLQLSPLAKTTQGGTSPNLQLSPLAKTAHGGTSPDLQLSPLASNTRKTTPSPTPDPSLPSDCDSSKPELSTADQFHRSGTTSPSSPPFSLTQQPNLVTTTPSPTDQGRGAREPGPGSGVSTGRLFANTVASPKLGGAQVSVPGEGSGRGHMPEAASDTHSGPRSLGEGGAGSLGGVGGQKFVPAAAAAASLDSVGAGGLLYSGSEVVGLVSADRISGEPVSARLPLSADPLSPKQDPSMATGSASGQVKPCPDLKPHPDLKPCPDLTTQVGVTYSGQPIDSRGPASLPPNTTQHSPGPLSTSGALPLLPASRKVPRPLHQPITTSSLIRGSTSSTYLPVPSTSSSSSSHYGGSSPQGMPSPAVSSALPNEPSRCQTKQPTPFAAVPAATDVPAASTTAAVSAQQGAGLRRVTAPSALSSLTSPRSPPGRVPPGQLQPDKWPGWSPPSWEPEVTGEHLNSAVPPQASQASSCGAVGSPDLEDSSENLVGGGGGGLGSDFKPTGPTAGGGYNSNQLGTTDGEPSTLAERATRVKHGASGSNPGQESELAGAAPSQDRCKQDAQLPADREKCFEVKPEWPLVPKDDSDSIISLAGTGATLPDNTLGSLRPGTQTMASVLLKGGPRGPGTLISEGVLAAGKGEAMATSRSVQMASVLLSQLESELANSLNESNT